MTVECHNCNKEIIGMPYTFRDLTGIKTFCSETCRMVYKQENGVR